jgi:hypothetical protein
MNTLQYTLNTVEALILKGEALLREDWGQGLLLLGVAGGSLAGLVSLLG